MTAPIRTAIVSKLKAVPDVGNVHPFERYAADQQSLKAFYQATIAGIDTLAGWYVRAFSIDEQSPATGRNVETVLWHLRGYRSLSDADQSEISFSAVIESIRDAFRADETLGGVVASTVTDEGAGIQLKETGPVLFAGVLCHSAMLTLTTRRYL